jgi:hypothetical protein
MPTGAARQAPGPTGIGIGPGRENGRNSVDSHADPKPDTDGIHNQCADNNADAHAHTDRHSNVNDNEHANRDADA